MIAKHRKLSKRQKHKKTRLCVVIFNLVHLVRLKTVKCFQTGLRNWELSMWEAILASLKAWMGKKESSRVNTISLLSSCYDLIHSVPPRPPL